MLNSYERAAEERLFPDIYSTFLGYREMSGDPAGLQQLQHDRLRALLMHAAQNVPFYRPFSAALAEEADPWAALAMLPASTKKVISASLLDHCADDLEPSRCRFATTSGTTGIPFKFIRDMDHRVHVSALNMLRNERWNAPTGHKILYVFPEWLDRWFEITAPSQGFARVAMCGGIGDASYWGKIPRQVREFQPDVIFGPPPCVLDLRDRLSGTAGEALRPRVVNTCGERLTPGARRSISAFFSAPVIDSYGMNEVESIATECSHGRYHIECERLVVEILDPAGNILPDGTAGEIVVTNLINKAMPLIRYRTGDIGSLASEPCPCGLPHKILTVLEGRDTGKIPLPAGGKIEAIEIGWLAQKYAVERYQAVQQTPTEITILITPLGSWTADDAVDLGRRAEELLARQIHVTVKAADSSEFVRKRNHKVPDYINTMRDAADNAAHAEPQHA